MANSGHTRIDIPFSSGAIVRLIQKVTWVDINTSVKKVEELKDLNLDDAESLEHH